MLLKQKTHQGTNFSLGLAECTSPKPRQDPIDAHRHAVNNNGRNKIHDAIGDLMYTISKSTCNNTLRRINKWNWKKIQEKFEDLKQFHSLYVSLILALLTLIRGKRMFMYDNYHTHDLTTIFGNENCFFHTICVLSLCLPKCFVQKGHQKELTISPL